MIAGATFGGDRHLFALADNGDESPQSLGIAIQTFEKFGEDEIAVFVTEFRVGLRHDFVFFTPTFSAGRMFVVSVFATPKVEQFEDYATTGDTNRCEEYHVKRLRGKE